MPYLSDARGWLLAALSSAESYVNDMDTLTKVNGLTHDEPVVVPAVGAADGIRRSYAHDVDTLVKVNALGTPGEPAVAPGDGAQTLSISGAVPTTPLEKDQEMKTTKVDEEMEKIAAHKKELDALNVEYMDVPYGSKAQLVHLDKRWDKSGNEYYIRQEKAALRIVGMDWWEKHILAVIIHFDAELEEFEFFEKVTVEVYSQHLRKILAEVIGNYPGVSFLTEHISLTLPAHCLYHYLSELRAEAETLQEGSTELEHLNVLLKFIETQFAETIEEVNNLRPHNLITYDTLWTIFRPDTIVHCKVRGYDRAFKLRSAHEFTDPVFDEHSGFRLLGKYMDYDGQNFGSRLEVLMIPTFTGSRPIASLPVAPLDMRPEKDEIRMALIERGQRVQLMKGQCYGEYVGAAYEQRPLPEEGRKFSIKGRVMIDGKSYNRICADFAWEAQDEEADSNLYSFEDILFPQERAASKARLAAQKSVRDFTEEECLLATNILRGFSFSEKRWFLLFIENFSEVEWNQASFDRLVLPEESKNLLLALVSSHLRGDNSGFDDIIKGKGRGLVILLHGSRGMGKTLTAECIAEYTGSPLFVLSAVKLGATRLTLPTPTADDIPELQEIYEVRRARSNMAVMPADLARDLKQIFDLAHTWKAILLIDEADVFLAERTLTDVHRNALVSVFLRLLEQYQGILFLTTNRVNTFDPAFKSRIHMALHYENIDTQAFWRAQLREIQQRIQSSA
ncbi:AAA family ATPase [Mycena sanguinolenta]|uniref:AAA family ATPase n=1 Tax=Mycena sanguinolenta TaxID=230812 RepID=A0A8H6XAA8_9AGAR|nr:AAA family ATPase [Mycena sanguinolenta]